MQREAEEYKEKLADLSRRLDENERLLQGERGQVSELRSSLQGRELELVDMKKLNEELELRLSQEQYRFNVNSFP